MDTPLSLPKTLRPFQKKAIQALSEGVADGARHLLCVAPTGSGKSLIYEHFACAGRKLLLVTPLVSLARQQHAKLRALGVDARLHAGGERQPPPERGSGIWIVSPETLPSASTRAMIDRFAPELLVVDECHCLWEWGEGFRPAFHEVPALVRESRIRQSLWLTATMPKGARAQLRALLASAGESLLEMGAFDLPANLSVHAERVPWDRRVEALVQIVSRRDGAGIVFVQTREATARISRLLEAMGRRAWVYHAGMSVEERLAIEALVARGGTEIVVSTSAFGMGMDYAHLRWALLWQAPPSLLTLSQMVGRVGRTEQGTAIVLWDDEDFRLIEWMAGESERRRAELLTTRRFLEDARCRRVSLSEYFDPSPASAQRCLRCDRCASVNFPAVSACP